MKCLDSSRLRSYCSKRDSQRATDLPHLNRARCHLYAAESFVQSRTRGSTYSHVLLLGVRVAQAAE
eukprot:scaffold34038_cov62-Phaeocystis_antarctica.AAC.3